MFLTCVFHWCCSFIVDELRGFRSDGSIARLSCSLWWAGAHGHSLRGVCAMCWWQSAVGLAEHLHYLADLEMQGWGRTCTTSKVVCSNDVGYFHAEQGMAISTSSLVLA